MELKLKHDIPLCLPSWWNQIKKEKRAAVMNGCGPSSWKTKFNTVWGLDIKDACNVHDVEYVFGNSRSSADARLFANLCLLIAARSSRILMPFRIIRAFTMYALVRESGWRFYSGS